MDAIVLHSDLQPFVQLTIRPKVSVLQVSRLVLAAEYRTDRSSTTERMYLMIPFEKSVLS
jgi:hypothetical protein